MRGTFIAVGALCWVLALAVASAALRLSDSARPLVADPAPEAMRVTVEELAREQAANSELVAELRTTVARLQDELAQRRSESLGAPTPQGRTLAVLGGNFFAPGEATLAPEALTAVRALLPALREAGGMIVSIEGHTDSRPIRPESGKPFKDNTELSELRARAVAEALVASGLPVTGLRVAGWGDTRPLASNDTVEGRERNRRVEVRLLPAAAAN